MSQQEDIFSAEINQVWQLPTKALKLVSNEDDNVGTVFSETLIASPEGIIAKNSFILAHGKHPTRNFFVFYRKDVGDMVFLNRNTIDNADCTMSVKSALLISSLLGVGVPFPLLVLMTRIMSTTLSSRNGMDHLNKSIWFGKWKGCSTSLYCLMLIFSFSIRITAPLLWYSPQ